MRNRNLRAELNFAEHLPVSLTPQTRGRNQSRSADPPPGLTTGSPAGIIPHESAPACIMTLASELHLARDHGG
jgi:hypothetical protein